MGLKKKRLCGLHLFLESRLSAYTHNKLLFFILFLSRKRIAFCKHCGLTSKQASI